MACCDYTQHLRNAHEIISRFLAVSGNPLRSIPETKMVNYFVSIPA